MSLFGESLSGKRQTTVFFRNDDVGLFCPNGVSSELVEITDLFIQETVPISHGVVPKSINSEAIEWLKSEKAKHPELIGIDQHGYAHANHGRGEFFLNRSAIQQQKDIQAGLDLMIRYFGEAFSWCFSPPGNRYDRRTKMICDKLGFRIFSGAVSPKPLARGFFVLGRMLNRNLLFGKHISYHRNKQYGQRGFSISELSVGIGLVGDYRRRLIRPLDALLKRFEACERHYDVVGINLHHWVFDSPEKIALVQEYIQNLKKRPNVVLMKLEDIASEISAQKKVNNR